MSGGAAPAGGVGARNVILIGYRASGKSSVGQRLATRLKWSFVDTDARVELAAGRSIREIFAQDGEAAFRRWEAAAVAQTTRGTRQVISVGGGAVLSAANRDALRAAGVCIWLRAPAEDLCQRMQADSGSGARRPALTAGSGQDEVRHLLHERQPLYAALAEHVVDTAGRSAEQVVEAILAVLSGNSSSSAT